jgi:hypothetical protein
MTAWRLEALADIDLLQTSLERKYPDRIYSHCQFKGALPKLEDFEKAATEERELTKISRELSARARYSNAIQGNIDAGDIEIDLEARKDELEARHMPMLLDDCHSPVRPAHYVELRLQIMVEKYQREIPWCDKWRVFWEIVLTCCTVASATLSYLDGTSGYVAISSSVAAAVTSWLSHAELVRRIERYSKSVRAIDDLLWWWKSLDDAERAGIANITKLIETGEKILSAERLAWMAAARRGDKDSAEGTNKEQPSDGRDRAK